MIKLPEKLQLLPVHFQQAKQEADQPQSLLCECCLIHQALRPYIPAGYVLNVEACDLYFHPPEEDQPETVLPLSREASAFIREWDDAWSRDEYPGDSREIRLLAGPEDLDPYAELGWHDDEEEASDGW